MVLLAIGTSACVDHEVENIKVNKPESIVLQEEIDSYAALKSYIDRDKNPNFKLGAGASLSDYMAKGVFYRLINRNFDEITLGYEMKHGAVVQEDGSLSLGNVEGLLAEAAAAGITVYGHTLAWHANQNAAYLNSTLAPTVIPGTGGSAFDPSVITNTDFESGIDGWGGWGNGSTNAISAEGEGYDGMGYAFTFTNPSVVQYYEAQVAYDLSPLEMGSTYVLEFKLKASGTGAIRAELQSTTDWSSDPFGSPFEISEDWKEYTLETKVTKEDRNRFLFSYGDFEGTVYIDDITLRRVNPSGGGSGGDFSIADFDTDDLGESYSMTNGGSGTVVDDPQGGGSKVLNIQGAQTFPQFEVTLPAGITLENCVSVTMDFLGTGSTGMYGAGMRMSINGGPLANYDSPANFGAADGAWARGVIKLDISGLELTEEQKGLNSFTLEVGSATGSADYYIDNISMNWEISGDIIIEKTPEEKKEIISEELERWIAGMLEVSKAHVKTWDVLNEPMDDGNPYELKTGEGRTLAADEFYWQDYLGKDYVVEAFRLAREYGNPDDIHFINDYNLEYNLDKCKGIIQLVEYIESKGEVVDGIGTQMHIDINSDKGKIAEMLELLAATGKLIKISELDIGLGGVSTNAATAEQYQAQAEMYQYVVEKYFEVIPANQRYGITIWATTDSPADSFWRAGEPIGLWTEGFVRKPAYTAVADGLDESK